MKKLSMKQLKATKKEIKKSINVLDEFEDVVINKKDIGEKLHDDLCDILGIDEKSTQLDADGFISEICDEYGVKKTDNSSNEELFKAIRKSLKKDKKKIKKEINKRKVKKFRKTITFGIWK